MPEIHRLLAAALFPLFVSLPGASAGELSETENVSPDEKRWNTTLSAGWDSLYLFRGVNALRGDLSYGASLSWFDLNGSWKITGNDTFWGGVKVSIAF